MEVYVKNQVVCSIEKADTFWQRLRGLMFRKELQSKRGLLLRRCSKIHTCFMRFTIDVIYLDEYDTVMESETVKPWRIGKRVKGAKHVLELPEGNKEQYPVGTRIRLEEEKE